MIICIKLFIDGSAGIEGLVEFITVCTVKIQIYQSLHILIGEYLILIHNCNEVIQLVRVGFAGQNRRAIIPRERLLNHLRLVCKVQDKSVILFRAAAVKSGKRLHSLDIASICFDRSLKLRNNTNFCNRKRCIIFIRHFYLTLRKQCSYFLAIPMSR